MCIPLYTNSIKYEYTYIYIDMWYLASPILIPSVRPHRLCHKASCIARNSPVWVMNLGRLLFQLWHLLNEVTDGVLDLPTRQAFSKHGVPRKPWGNGRISRVKFFPADAYAILCLQKNNSRNGASMVHMICNASHGLCQASKFGLIRSLEGHLAADLLRVWRNATDIWISW